jgi:hypothetical protein
MTVKSNRSGGLDEIVTAPIPKFRKISGIGNTKTNELINVGVTDDEGNVLKLETVAIGSRCLIILASWRRIVEHQWRHPVTLKLRGRR